MKAKGTPFYEKTQPQTTPLRLPDPVCHLFRGGKHDFPPGHGPAGRRQLPGRSGRLHPHRRRHRHFGYDRRGAGGLLHE